MAEGTGWTRGASERREALWRRGDGDWSEPRDGVCDVSFFFLSFFFGGGAYLAALPFWFLARYFSFFPLPTSARATTYSP